MMRLLSMRAIASFALAFSAALVGDASIVRADGLVDRGEYLATIMDCAGCHTGGVLAGKPDPARHLSGSEVGFQLPTRELQAHKFHTIPSPLCNSPVRK